MENQQGNDVHCTVRYQEPICTYISMLHESVVAWASRPHRYLLGLSIESCSINDHFSQISA